MKRLFFSLVAIATMGMVAVSCDKEPNGNGNGGNETVKARLSVYSLTDLEGWTDYYKFTYNTDGKVTKVIQYYKENGENVTDKEWNLAYSGNTITMTGRDAVTFTLGSNGYVSKLKLGDDTYDYAYNSGSYLTKIEKNGVVVSNQVIIDDCIVSWSRFKEEVEQKKVQTYMNKKNIAGLHTTHNDKAALERRWLFEAGLFGKTSIYMTETSGWEGSEKATYSYEYDTNGLPIKEMKDYPGWPEVFNFEWEILN